MNFRTVLMALTVAAMAAFGTGCGSACDDLQDCCEALNLGAACAAYDDADEDQCEAAKDQLTNAATGDVPEECDF